MKVVDKYNEKAANGETFFSFEYFPPRTDEGVENLLERQERMVAYGPLFCDITWGAGGTTADVTLDIANKMQNQICVDTMMHLTCTNITVDRIEAALAEAKKMGIKNILALRGDPPKGQEKFEAVEGGFSCALDLVKFIREKHGDYFGIAVAGYPEAHPDTIVDDPEQMEKNYWANIDYLKQKIDAGGELIVTQLFYDVDIFLKFVKDCREKGIKAPILPGIMPIMTYGGFKRMTGFCKTKVPQDLLDKVEELKEDEEGLKAFGIQHGAAMCKKILDAGIPGLHMYSLNLEATVLGILQILGMVQAHPHKALPWKHVPAGTRRKSEGVRPIFWANRTRSYVKRTAASETFPAARWGQGCTISALPSDEELRYHTASTGRKAKALAAWGPELSSVDQVKAIFSKFYSGELAVFPWSETAYVDQGSLKPRLAALIAKGMLPINAQAAVCGTASSDAAFGWGPVGGHVYQKGYVEFFVSPEQFKTLLPELQAAGPQVTFMASNKDGTEASASPNASAVSAVSWGVFPGSEIVEPYVSDLASFKLWAQEAFALWTAEFGAAFEEVPAVLKEIQSSWVLVSVLSHDYISSDAIKVLGA